MISMTLPSGCATGHKGAEQRMPYALPYNLPFLARMCIFWPGFQVCSDLSCLVSYSVHAFSCPVRLYMPGPEFLAQEAAVHQRKKLLLARF